MEFPGIEITPQTITLILLLISEVLGLSTYTQYNGLLHFCFKILNKTVTVDVREVEPQSLAGDVEPATSGEINGGRGTSG